MRKHSILIVLFTFLFANTLLGQEQADDESEPHTAYSSSADTNHPCNLAIDSREDTWWQPAPNDDSPEWILDLGKKRMIMEFEAKFFKENIYHYTVDVSDDKTNWETVSQMKYDIIVKGHIITGNKMIGRYIRIKFDKSTPIPQITEVETYCTDIKEE